MTSGARNGGEKHKKMEDETWATSISYSPQAGRRLSSITTKTSLYGRRSFGFSNQESPIVKSHLRPILILRAIKGYILTWRLIFMFGNQRLFVCPSTKRSDLCFHCIFYLFSVMDCFNLPKSKCRVLKAANQKEEKQAYFLPFKTAISVSTEYQSMFWECFAIMY